MRHTTRVGYRLHQSLFGERKGREGYYAACDSCEWDGKLRDTEQEAVNDLDQHVKTPAKSPTAAIDTD